MGFSVGGWDELGTVDRIRARVSLADLVGRAGRRTGSTETATAFHGRGRTVFLLRGEPAVVMSALVDALAESPPGRPGTRMALVTGWTDGLLAHPVAESLRLLGRVPDGGDDTRLRVTFTDLLYEHLAAGADKGAAPFGFQRVRGAGLGPDVWTWPSTAALEGGRRRVRPGAVLIPWLDRWIRVKSRRGDHEGAIRLLYRRLRFRPSPEAVMALGECHLAGGEPHAAEEAWLYLVRRRPLMLRAYLLLGRLAECDDVAAARLGEGIHLLGRFPAAAEAPAALRHELLLELARRAYRRRRQAEGDRFLNEAAAVRPDGAGPLLLLAGDAQRRGDAAMTRQMLEAARAREETGY